jgi:hypothetical protein
MTDEESRLAERGLVVQAAHVADLHGGGVEEPLTRRDHAPRGIPALGVGSRLVALGRDDTVGRQMRIPPISRNTPARRI